MLDARFSYASFVSAAQQPAASPFRDTPGAPLEELASALAQEIERRLRSAKRPQREMEILLEELHHLGHEVWSFDALDDWESFTTWGDAAKDFAWSLDIDVTYSAPQMAEVAFRPRVT